MAFGDTDVYAIAEFRDNAAAAAAALAVAAGGGVEVKTVVLRTPSEADVATKNAAEYRPRAADSGTRPFVGGRPSDHGTWSLDSKPRPRIPETGPSPRTVESAANQSRAVAQLG